MIGRTLGYHAIEAKLGEGGMGVVYKARDTRLRRLVALKVLPPDKVTDPERKRRFVQEAQAASALNHPNIITIYDIGSDAGVDFMAMEYVAGKTLDRLIPGQGLPAGEALKIAIQLADGLAAAHAAGIVHRDLKPGNVMVTESGLVKILDFGLAKLTDVSDPDRTLDAQTVEGTILGTVAYMSPEQAQGKKLDARSDIFSFGVMLYELVTGRRPFSGDSPAATLLAILRDDPPPVADLPPDLQKLLARCLRKDPARRFQHMADIKVALEDLKDETQSGTGITAPTPRRLRKWWAAVVGLTVAGVGLWFLLSEWSATEQPLTAVPVTSYPGFESEPSFSPEGNQVAFSWNGPNEDNCDIYVKLIGPGEPLRLTNHPEPEVSPAWSPDGTWIAFIRRVSPDRAAVYLIPALGGPERRVGELSSPFLFASSPSDLNFFTGPFVTWAPDSKRLIVVSKTSVQEPHALFLLSPDTGERRSMTVPPAGILGDTGPAVSPDGRVLAFTRYYGMLVSDVYRLDLTSDLRPAGEPRKFPPVSPWNHSPCWTSDGVEIFFSTRLGLGAPFERREATGAGRTRPVMVPGDGCWYPAISRRGRRLIYSSLTFDSNIWSVDLLPTGQPAGTPTPATTTTRVEAYPTYAPDGKRLSMISNRMGPLEVWVADRDGSNAAQVTSIGGPHINAPRWSPDGRYIAFTSSQLGQPEIYVVSPEGGAPIRVTPHAAQDVLPGWSHDGKWLYFASDRSGEQQVWKVQLGAGGPAGEPVQVTRHGGSAPRESPDGQFLYYAKGGVHNPSLWRRRVGSEHEEKVLESLTYSTNYAVTRHGIFFAPAPRRGESSTISFLRFATGKIEIVATTPKTIFVGLDAAVGPDGIARSVAWTQFDRKNADLMLVENFR